MKKNVFLAVTLLAFITVGAFAQSESDFKVTKTGNAITITGYTGSAIAVNIPSRIQNLPVTVIGDRAFASNTKLTSVTIPEGVTTIGNTAFNGCSMLRSVTIPSTVTSIDIGAFANCYGLDSVTFLGTISPRWKISSSAFPDDGLIDKFYATDKDKGTPGTYKKSGNTWTLTPAVVAGLNESDFTVKKEGNAIKITDYVGKATVVTIPATIQNLPVTIIGANAFYGKTVTSVTIPNSVTTIEKSAFFGCRDLASVTIGSGVKSIGMGAFASCNALVSVTFLGTIPAGSFDDSESMAAVFSGDLRDKFYAANKTNGTPGTYTKSGKLWTKK
jgi:hypothetical protein